MDLFAIEERTKTKQKANEMLFVKGKNERKVLNELMISE
jgi:hypothetical protein